MKRLFGKRWHRIPVALVAVALALILMTGSALAVNGHPFFTSTLQAQLEEALVVGAFDTWDNLHPYGSDSSAVWVDSGAHDELPPIGTLGDIKVTLGGTLELPEISITHSAETPYAGEGFVAGEWIVIPLNIRNASDGTLILSASVAGDNNLVLEYIWQENIGDVTSTESGQDMCREFVASGSWASLDSWEGEIEGYEGKSGSAVIGAQILFVRVRVPGNAVPGPCTVTVALNRS